MKFELSPRAVLLTSGIATLATTVAAVLLSRREAGHSASALNAVSHMVWGDEALRENDWDVRHSLTGGALNAAAMVSWGAVYELLPQPKTVTGALAKGALVTALAYGTDYYLVPKRFTPGFEQRLSRPGLAILYGILAAALGARSAAVATRARALSQA